MGRDCNSHSPCGNWGTWYSIIHLLLGHRTRPRSNAFWLTVLFFSTDSRDTFVRSNVSVAVHTTLCPAAVMSILQHRSRKGYAGVRLTLVQWPHCAPIQPREKLLGTWVLPSRPVISLKPPITETFTLYDTVAKALITGVTFSDK